MAKRLTAGLVMVALLALGTVLVTPTAAAAAAAPNGTYSNWAWPTNANGYYNFDQRLTVLGHTAGTHYFWAHQFGFIGGNGGYLGVQVGSYPNYTKIALFSLWGANGAEGPNCGPFTEGGSGGYTCRLDPYDWVTGRAYRLRVWDNGADSLGDWWGAVSAHVRSSRIPAPLYRAIARETWYEFAARLGANLPPPPLI